MDRDIDDHKKADLEKVFCDFLICEHRGDFGRCYMDIYKGCEHYQIHEEWKRRPPTSSP